jgi:heterodisulfide reductase subunit A
VPEPDGKGPTSSLPAPGTEPKVGVYVCHCGLNIAEKVDVEQVVAFAATLPHVTIARDYKFMCSDPGQELIVEDVRSGLVNRVVVASCSPLMHEATFRRATESGGISPFDFQMASIREQVSWVTADGEDATEKAKALIAGAVRRVTFQEQLERRRVPVHPDVLVVGGGISGLHAALTLADAGKKVHLVEREPSIGGHMAMFDKTFPTLDCAACILTPKMVQAGQHENIDLLTYSELEEVSGYVGDFDVRVRKKARFIDEDLCNGCGDCIASCSRTDILSEFDQGLGTRSAVYMPFPQAVPRLPVIDRAGSSPCAFTCPAGIKAHGYVSLMRKGDYEKAFELVLEATPLVGSLGRACYAPCESECARASLEGPVPIRLFKRHLADRYYAENESASFEAPPARDKRVAIVGSGPAGLTAAWQLARRGYGVKIFEAAPEPGGMLRLAIPDYRLPPEVVERDIANVTALGVEIATNTRLDDLDQLKSDGYDAILVATGTPLSSSLGVPGEELDGVVRDLQFLRSVKLDRVADLKGKRAVVVGGGNTAMDAARTARRLGAETVVAYRRSREEMPARPEEIEGAEREGVRFELQVAPVEIVGKRGKVIGLRCVRTSLGEPDESGRRRPEPIPGSEFVIDCDTLIVAIGTAPDTASLAPRLKTSRNGTIEADPETLQTEISHVFAAGDVVMGALDIAHAVGQGRRAAFMIERFLEGEELDGASFDPMLPVVDKAEVLARKSYERREPPAHEVSLAAAPSDFSEIEPPLSEEEAGYALERCLDCGICSECGRCVSVCPADAVDLVQGDRELELKVGAIVVATGHKVFDARRMPEYGYGKHANVYTSLEVERLVNASGPTGGEIVMRDGDRPKSVGIIHCVGSRDAKHNSYCSRVCCMYSLKLAHLVKERSGAEVFNFYIDMRTPGKGYEEFYDKLLGEGVNFVRGRVAEVSDAPVNEEEKGKLVIRVEDTLIGIVRRIPVDMVVLAVGLEPQPDADDLRRLLNIGCGSEGFFTERHPKLAPVSTFTDGIFLAGTCQGPKDIPDSVAQAGAAAAEALALIDRGTVELEPSTAFIDPEACSGCRTCVGLCPFGAIAFDGEKKIAAVNDVVCKGCGVCVAACPSGAAQQHMFTDDQILAEIEGVLGSVQ